jgi:hypothetical protein
LNRSSLQQKVTDLHNVSSSWVFFEVRFSFRKDGSKIRWFETGSNKPRRLAAAAGRVKNVTMARQSLLAFYTRKTITRKVSNQLMTSRRIARQEDAKAKCPHLQCS